jgi:hypothetical protein
VQHIKNEVDFVNSKINGNKCSAQFIGKNLSKKYPEISMFDTQKVESFEKGKMVSVKI